MPNQDDRPGEPAPVPRPPKPAAMRAVLDSVRVKAVQGSTSLHDLALPADAVAGVTAHVRLFHESPESTTPTIEYQIAYDNAPLPPDKADRSAAIDPLKAANLGTITVVLPNGEEKCLVVTRDDIGQAKNPDAVPIDLTRGIAIKTAYVPPTKPIGPLFDITITTST